MRMVQIKINITSFFCIKNKYENSIATFWEDWWENIRRNRPDKWRNNSWALHRGKKKSISGVAHCVAFFGSHEHDGHSPTLPTHRTSSPVIFSYSQSWDLSSRGDVLTALKRSWPNRRTWRRRWHEMTSSCAPITEIPLGYLCQCQRGLLLRGRRQIEISVSVSAAAEEFRELLGSTSYILYP